MKHARKLASHFRLLNVVLVCLLTLSLLSLVLVSSVQNSLEATTTTTTTTTTQPQPLSAEMLRDAIQQEIDDCLERGISALRSGEPNTECDISSLIPPPTTQPSPGSPAQQALQWQLDSCLGAGGIPSVHVSYSVLSINCAHAAPRAEGRTLKFGTPAKCWKYRTSLDVSEALNLLAGSKEFATCIPTGMLQSSQGYSGPNWGYDRNIYSTYGWVLVKEDGDCSGTFFFAPGQRGYDFRVACKAHDYCYDLIRAGLSYPLSQGSCNRIFFDMLDAHCNNVGYPNGLYCIGDKIAAKTAIRRLSAARSPGIVRLIPKLASQIPSIQPKSSKCLALEGSSNNIEILRLGSCRSISGIKEFRLVPVNVDRGDINDSSKYGLFQIQLAALNTKCLVQDFSSTANRVILADCDKSNSSQHFRVVSIVPTSDGYYIKNASDNLCLNVVGDTEGATAMMGSCNLVDNEKVWKIVE